MADVDSKKVAPKVNCGVCDKELCKGSLKRHMKDQHNSEETTKKNDEVSNGNQEESAKQTKDSKEKEEESTEKAVESTERDMSNSTNTKVVHDLINLDTKELENLLENEEYFLDAVESLENNLCLDVDLSVNESMIAFMQDQNNYQSVFARTVELEETDKTRKENKGRLEKEVQNAKNTIVFLRKCVKSLKEECTNGAKEYRGLSNRYRKSKQSIRRLELELKETRDHLATTSKDNIVLKQKLETKVSMEKVNMDNTQDNEKILKEPKRPEFKMTCEKCDFVAKNVGELRGHEKYIHVDCHVCGKHFATVKELNRHIENVHRLKQYDCAWCKLSFPNETGFEVHRRKKHEEWFQFKSCSSKFTHKNQLLSHINKEHEIKCIFKECEYKTETENQMIIHLDEEHWVASSTERIENRPTFKKKECRYYKQGKCTKGIECRFEHI